jgi:hypothetical protein
MPLDMARLQLRPLVEQDADAIISIAGDREVGRGVGAGSPLSHRRRGMSASRASLSAEPWAQLRKVPWKGLLHLAAEAVWRGHHKRTFAAANWLPQNRPFATRVIHGIALVSNDFLFRWLRNVLHVHLVNRAVELEWCLCAIVERDGRT